jgi:hypothetical protein
MLIKHKYAMRKISSAHIGMACNVGYEETVSTYIDIRSW